MEPSAGLLGRVRQLTRDQRERLHQRLASRRQLGLASLPKVWGSAVSAI